MYVQLCRWGCGYLQVSLWDPLVKHCWRVGLKPAFSNYVTLVKSQALLSFRCPMYRTGVINIYYLTLSLLWALRESVYGQHNVWWHSAWHILRALMLAGIIYYPEVEVSALFGPWLLHLASVHFSLASAWNLPFLCPKPPTLSFKMGRGSLSEKTCVTPFTFSPLYTDMSLFLLQ